MATKVEVYPKPGETYPDADGVAITSAGAIVWASKYIEDAIRDGFLLTYDPYGVGIPDDRTDTLPPADGAPSNAPYVLTASTPELPDGRVLTAGTGISVAVGGPGGAVVVSATGVAPPVDAEYLVAASHGTLTAERVLTAGAGIALTPTAGALAVSSTVVAPAAPVVLPPNVAAASSLGTPGEYATAQHTHGHGDQAGGSLHALATTTVPGFVSGAEKVKINAIPASGAAPADAQYLVSSASAGLSAERVLTAGAGISLTPGAGTLTVAASGPVSAPVDAEYLVGSSSAVLSNERVLLAGPGISLTPGGGTLTVSNIAVGSDAVQGPASSTDDALTRWDGTTGNLVQSSVATLDDAGLLSTASLSIAGDISVAGMVDGVDVGNLALALASVAVPSYVTLESTPTLMSERVLTAGPGITITDGGPGGPVTIESTATGGAPVDAEYLVSVASGGLSAERVLTAGAGISLTPSAGALTVASTATAGAPVGAQYLTLAADGTLTNERVFTAGPGVAVADGGAGGAFTVGQFRGRNATSGPYMFVLADAFKVVSNGTPDTTFTIPTAASVPFPDGTVLYVNHNTSGLLTILADAGVTLRNRTSGSAYLTQGSFATLSKVTGNVWDLYGETTITRAVANVTSGVTARTLFLSDQNKLLTFNAATTITVTIPDNATVALPGGTEVWLEQLSLGQVTVTPAAGVTLNTPAGFSAATRNQWSVIKLFKRSTDVWDLSGELADTTSYLTLGATSALPNERVLTEGSGVTLTDGGPGGALTVSSTGNGAQMLLGSSPYTLVLSDAGRTINGSLPGATTVNIPNNATVNFPVGTEVFIFQGGAGKITLAGIGGVTLLAPPGKTADCAGANSTVRAYQLVTNYWVLDGGLSDATQYLTLAATAAHPNERVLTAGAGITLTDGGAGGALTVAAAPALALNNQTGTAYTLALADGDKCVTMNNAAANTLTIPANASVAFPIGTVITVMQLGVGQTTIAITTDTLLNPALTAKLRARYSVASLTKITATSWVLSGDLAAS